ncbi:hypothetical protein OEW28_09500 [Defluviimonas sp. WL0002]|uniref:Uncharacterized protein n=1 Tax=Albidovulum marisflavi TaxID=2984159 RepID=A0ABT2ZCQ1_9RHOB|nr:hypothetical protein [Defluviimonas sp. WL0002]MCV2868862.1 hypothetical protein [Defluviimonas sp. WL0002]
MTTREIRQTSAEMAEAAREKGAEAMKAARKQTEEIAQDAGQALKRVSKDRAESGKDALADQGEALASKLRHEAAGDGTLRSRLLGVVADGVGEASEDLRDQSLSSLLSRAESFARQHPGVFVAGAAVAGFALARFAQASGQAGVPVTGSGGRDSRPNVRRGPEGKDQPDDPAVLVAGHPDKQEASGGKTP